MHLFPQRFVVFSVSCIFAAAAPAQSIYERYRFTTLAGNPPSIGSSDGAGSAARFAYPRGNAVDAAGNIYVADAGNYTIRKITPAGVVTTVAGLAGVRGFENGKGSSARFDLLEAIAVDSARNLYVTDNFAIRKITPSGDVSTLTGLPGQHGSADGPPGTAQFGYLWGISADDAGNLYVGDENATIRKIDPTGVVTTLAGSARQYGSNDGPANLARFRYPAGIALDSKGNLFVADVLNNTIRKITPAGLVTTFAGTAGVAGRADGTGNTAEFSFPFGVAIDDADNVYISEAGNNTIRKITPAAVVTTLAGGFGRPIGVSVNSAQDVFVTDHVNQTICKITPNGNVTIFAGVADSPGDVDGSGAAVRFNRPTAVVKDHAGNSYVADSGNSKIRKIAPDGTVSTFAGSGFVGSEDGAGSAARFTRPAGIVIDSHGNLFVSDSGRYPFSSGNTLRKITPAGVVTTVAAGFNWPGGIAIDGADNIYMAEAGANRISKITPGGVVTTVAGSGNRGFTDGTGTAATFFGPGAVAATPDGTLYVADTGNEAIRKITPAGEVTTLAGSMIRGSADGIGSAARFYLGESSGCYGFCDGGPRPLPRSKITGGVAVDKAGNVFVGDSLNHTIRKITPAGAVTTIAGLAGRPSMANGVGSAARFNEPNGLFVDDAGYVYVADTENAAIRVGGPTSVAQSQNISTRSRVEASDEALIAGFIVTGSVPKKVALRALGPTLANSKVAGFLPDPILELRDSTGAQLVTNDNWMEAASAAEVQAAGLAPANHVESAFVISLAPNQTYTAIVRGSGTDAGVAIVEVYDLNPAADSLLVNLSSRALVASGSDVMIGGFILGGGSGSDKVVVRALGPSLAQFGISNPLPDPTLELHNGHGALVASNDNWKDSDQAGIESTGLEPSHLSESAIVSTLPPGNYTAIVAGKHDDTGIGLVEIYNLQ